MKRDYQKLCDEYNETCKAIGITSRLETGKKGWLYERVQGAGPLPCRWDEAVRKLGGREAQLARMRAKQREVTPPAPRYKQMHNEQFKAALSQLNLDSAAFAYLTGADPRRVRRWLNGEEPSIPHWVTLVCTLLVHPEAIPLATKLARVMVNIVPKESADAV